MNYKKLSTSELLDHARLVWLAETPSGQPGGVEQSPDAPTTTPPENTEDAAVKDAEAAEQRERAAGARTSGDVESETSGAQADANLDTQLTETQQETAPQKPYTNEQINDALKRQNTAYSAFLGAAGKKDSKEDFLNSITNNEDRAVIKWALETEPMEEDRKEWEKTLKENPLTVAQITEQLKSGQLNYYEAKVAMSVAEKEGLAEKAGDLMAGTGFFAALEKLIEKITKLFEKLGKQMEETFSKKKLEEQSTQAPKVAGFEISPLGVGSKLDIEKVYNAETKTPLTIKAAPNTNVLASIAGRVTALDSQTGTVEIQDRVGKQLTYANLNLDPGITQGQDLTAGTKLGAVRGENFTLKLVDRDKKEQDPKPYLKAFI